MTRMKADDERQETNGIGYGCPNGVPNGNRRGRPARPAQTERHRAVIAMLVEDGAEFRGFTQAVKDATGCEFAVPPRMMPDAFTIDRDGWVVSIAEVEVYHPIDDAKWIKIREWYRVLRNAGWSMRLFCYDSRGGGAEVDIDTGQLTASEIDRVRNVMSKAGGFIP